jgi:hypothetical protein
MLSLKRDSAFLRGAVPALALEFLRFVLCLERWVACLARDRIRVAAVKASPTSFISALLRMNGFR